MKSEEAIRQTIRILEAFGSDSEKTEGIRALKWVLEEYPPQDPVEPPQTGGTAVRDGGRIL